MICLLLQLVNYFNSLNDYNRKHETLVSYATGTRQRVIIGRQLVGYSMDQVYEVVSDVKNYYKFVPWIRKSIVYIATPDYLKADLDVGIPPFNEVYSSYVTLVKPVMVKATCPEGRNFNSLNTLWQFSPGLKNVQQSCFIDFQMIIEFSSSLHSYLPNLFFNHVARKTESAFLNEVARRNGPGSIEPMRMI